MFLFLGHSKEVTWFEDEYVDPGPEDMCFEVKFLHKDVTKQENNFTENMFVAPSRAPSKYCLSFTLNDDTLLVTPEVFL